MLALIEPIRPVRPPAPLAAVGRVAPRVKVPVRREDTDWIAVMEGVRRQDVECFRMLFEHYAPRIKAFLMKGGTPAATAEDCAQDVMAKVWQKAALFDPARASVATWIFTIARNRRIDLVRRTRPIEAEDVNWGPSDVPDQAEAYDQTEDARRLAEAISALPEAQRTLVERAFWGDLSHSELQAETGLPLGTIKSRIRLALERLRGALGADDE